MAKRKRKFVRTTKNTGRGQKNPLPKLTVHKLDWLEWLAIGLGSWLWFFPHPYKLLFAVVLALPIAGLLLNGLTRPSLASLVSISRKDGEDKYDIADFIEFPGLIILIRVLVDYEFESFFSIIKVGTVAFIILLLLLGATHRLVEASNSNKWIIYLAVVGNIAVYSYAATYGVNCVFDYSAPKIYQAKVVNKSINKGRRHTSYYIKVEPWGSHHDPENISVPRSQYNETDIGQTVAIDYKEGLLGIPWYYIEGNSLVESGF